MRKVFLALAALLVAPVAMALTIATGSPDGTYYQIGKDIEKLMESSDVAIQVLPTNGSFENIDLLGNGRADLGIVQLDALKYFADVMREKGNLDVFERLKVVLNLYPEEIHVIANEKDISSFYDLADKKVAVGPQNSGTALTAALLFKMYDIPAQQLNLKQTDALDRLAQGEIDAMVFVAGSPVAVFQKLGEGFHLVRLPQNPGLDEIYARTVLGPEDYAWASEDVATYAVPSGVVMVDNGTERQMVDMSKLVLAILHGQTELKKSGHPKWNDSELGIVYEDVGYGPTNDIVKIYAILDSLGYGVVRKP